MRCGSLAVVARHGGLVGEVSRSGGLSVPTRLVRGRRRAQGLHGVVVRGSAG